MHNNKLYNKLINLRKNRQILKNQLRELRLQNKQIPENLLKQYRDISFDITQLTFLNEGHFGK